jgi:uncharacterized protein YjiS (DUF1127 family)
MWVVRGAIGLVITVLLSTGTSGMDVEGWLAEIELTQYGTNFAENALTDEGTIASLSDEDLKSIGITALGHRRQIMAAIEKLKAEGWTPKWDLGAWLKVQGLPQYQQAFVDNAIVSREDLSSLSQDDLKEIGITVLGHRKKLAAAIAGLSAPAKPSGTFSVTTPAEDATVEADRNLLVEVHQSHRNTDLWYHVGLVDPVTKSVDWGESEKYDQGQIPMCDFDGNTVVEVHQSRTGTDLWYQVGAVEPKSRTIEWSDASKFDRGRAPVVTFREDLVVEVHQSHSGTDLWSHVGRLDRASGSVDWGPSSKFDKGRIPSVGMPGTDLPTVVEVHQSHTGTSLWYHVGVVDDASLSIDWGESHNYDQGRLPMCDFDGTTIVEVHQGHDDLNLWYRVGVILERDRSIDWGESVRYDRGRIPTVAVNGSTVVEIHQSHEGESLWYTVGTLNTGSRTVSWGSASKYDIGRIPSIGY